MNKLTDWEVGQELIKISDTISESVADIGDSGSSDLIQELKRMMGQLGDELKKLKSHDFGIYDYNDYAKEFLE